MESDFEFRLFEQFAQIKSQGADARSFLQNVADALTDIEEKHYALSMLSTECEIQKDLKGAANALQACINLDPSIAASWIALARFHARVGNSESSAVEALNQVLEGQCYLSTDSQYAFTECMRIAAQLGRKDIAETALRHLLNCLPKAVDFSEPNCSLVDELRVIGVETSLIESYEGWRTRAN